MTCHRDYLLPGRFNQNGQLSSRGLAVRGTDTRNGGDMVDRGYTHTHLVRNLYVTIPFISVRLYDQVIPKPPSAMPPDSSPLIQSFCDHQIDKLFMAISVLSLVSILTSALDRCNMIQLVIVARRHLTCIFGVQYIAYPDCRGQTPTEDIRRLYDE